MAQLQYLPPTELVYQNHVPGRYFGCLIAKYFAARFTYLGEDEWVSRIRAGAITVNGEIVSPGYVLKEHDYIVNRMGPRTEPPANRVLTVLYEDARIRVFNKAAPIPVHPSGRYFKNSMTELLKEVYPDEVPRPVQRLDSTTTGVLVFAKTREAAAFLMDEFTENRVDKEYFALVEGTPGEKKFIIDAPIGKVKGSERGIGEHAVNPKSAVTEVEWLSAINNRSLLKVVPRSGRTNQIRVHLASAGLPVINDSVYGRPCPEGEGFGLHAHRLVFRCFERDLDLTASFPAHFQPFIDARP
jgi:23S rRNA pseudouridine1911/1915/1917 synthase